MNLNVIAKCYQLPLKHPFTISRYTVNIQETVVVCISDGKVTGYGEATVNPYYNITVEYLVEAIESVKSIVENSNGIEPENLWYLLEPKLRNNYFALCALDCAYWDYYARSNQRTLRSYWNGDYITNPKTNYTIGIDSIDKMKMKILEKPWPIYKIKLGTSNDIEIIKSLRLITKSVFRIDANCSWTVSETIKNAEFLKGIGVEFIEQPLKADNFEGMKQLKEKSQLPIIADESCQKISDVEVCAEVFHGINIKLMKCGGITPALKMIEKAREKNLLVMAGCMTESSVGISNLVQIAPLLDYIDADGAMLLEKDIAKGVSFINGEILFSQRSGSGGELL